MRRVSGSETLADLKKLISQPADHAAPNEAHAPTAPIAPTEKSRSRSIGVSESRARANEYEYPRWAQRWQSVASQHYLLPAMSSDISHVVAANSGRRKCENVRGPVLVISNHVTWVDVACSSSTPPSLRHKLAVAMEGERMWAMRYPRSNESLPPHLPSDCVFLVVALFNVFPLPKLSGFLELRLFR